MDWPTHFLVGRLTTMSFLEWKPPPLPPLSRELRILVVEILWVAAMIRRFLITGTGNSISGLIWSPRWVSIPFFFSSCWFVDGYFVSSPGYKIRFCLLIVFWVWIWIQHLYLRNAYSGGTLFNGYRWICSLFSPVSFPLNAFILMFVLSHWNRIKADISLVFIPPLKFFIFMHL